MCAARPQHISFRFALRRARIKIQTFKLFFGAAGLGAAARFFARFGREVERMRIRFRAGASDENTNFVWLNNLIN